jgi:DNA replication protein DnaC
LELIDFTTRDKRQRQTPEIEHNAIWQAFQTAEHMIDGVFASQTPAGLIFTGPPGLGKSHLVRRLAQKYRQSWDRSVMRPSASKLIDELQRRRSGCTLIFDDFDRIFDNENTLEIFKVILDTHDNRILSNMVRGKS